VVRATWQHSQATTPAGPVDAIAPEIISASRSTDIPAFYTDWLIHRLEAGYVKWTNPFNQQVQYVSFDRARVFVFWSKNPEPLLRRLDEIDRRGLAYYFQFTVNDYEREKLEPAVPPLSRRLSTFRELSKHIGRERTIWRFDPLILADDLTVVELLNRIRRVGDLLARYTDRLVFSFADIAPYKKVQNNLTREGFRFREFAQDEVAQAAEGIASLCKGWGIQAFTCAERVDLDRYGISHNKCVDDDLILRITDSDPELRRLFGRPATVQGSLLAGTAPPAKSIKDKGQREECSCVVSKDIGQYNTCGHLCVYCYANTSEKAISRARERAKLGCESISGE
jgi:hypothetical protein